MKLKKSAHLLILVIFTLLSVLIYVWFIKSSYFPTLLDWSAQNTTLLISILFLFKTISIVYPPLPGGLATIGAIPLLGWEIAYMIEFTGSILGATISFYLARKYGYPLLKALLSKDTINKISRLHIYPNRQIEAVFVLKLILGFAIGEVISYGAGLLNVRFKNFLFGSILANIILVGPLHFFADNLFKLKLELLPFALIIITISTLFLWKFRKRYFTFTKLSPTPLD